jgi:hypothetical protein
VRSFFGVVSTPSLQFFGRICKLAVEAKGRIAAGKNPQKERRAVRAEMTFGALFEDYIEVVRFV